MTVTNCFAIPHEESDDGTVAIQKEYNTHMIRLHQKVHPRETVVGWYSSTNDDMAEEISKMSCHIQEYYGMEVCKRNIPIHLLVDTALRDAQVSVKAYKTTPLTINEEALATQFQQVKVVMNMSEEEQVALNSMYSAQRSAPNVDQVTYSLT